MAFTKRKIAILGGTGILIAFLIIAMTPMMLPVANAGTLIIKSLMLRQILGILT